MIDIPVVQIRSGNAWRIIPSRYPPIPLFEGVAPPENWKFLADFGGRTNARLLEQDSTGGLIRAEDRKEESSSHYITGPLTHINPEGSRFSDGTYGVLYAGLVFETALAEVRHQREGFLRRTSEGPLRLDMRVIRIDLDGELYDLREDAAPVVDEIEVRELAGKLWADGAYGILFDSAHHRGGECIGVFRPPVLRNARQERHLSFVWDGNEITDTLEYSSTSPL